MGERWSAMMEESVGWVDEHRPCCHTFLLYPRPARLATPAPKWTNVPIIYVVVRS